MRAFLDAESIGEHMEYHRGLKLRYSILEKSIESLLKRGCTTNGEYYIDESLNDSINLGYKVKVLEIDSYINWGTPEELAMFNWWINFFNKIRHEYLA